MAERRHDKDEDEIRPSGRAGKRTPGQQERAGPVRAGPVDGAKEPPGPPVVPTPRPNDAMLEAAIEGARAMGEWSRAMGRDESPAESEEDTTVGAAPRDRRR
jgi:hypothetical protein